jgi:hypothetical protein
MTLVTVLLAKQKKCVFAYSTKDIELGTVPFVFSHCMPNANVVINVPREMESGHVTKHVFSVKSLSSSCSKRTEQLKYVPDVFVQGCYMLQQWVFVSFKHCVPVHFTPRNVIKGSSIRFF